MEKHRSSRKSFKLLALAFGLILVIAGAGMDPAGFGPATARWPPIFSTPLRKRVNRKLEDFSRN